MIESRIAATSLLFDDRRRFARRRYLLRNMETKNTATARILFGGNRRKPPHGSTLTCVVPCDIPNFSLGLRTVLS